MKKTTAKEKESGTARREEILARLSALAPTEPIAAAVLAAEFGVSRQVIVGDIALLRSAGYAIHATPRGYVLQREYAEGVKRTLLCCHSAEQMTEELNAIVDCGCTVLDVAVGHPIYGTLTGELHLSSRWDVQTFADAVRASDALPLSALTEGVHTHTILAPTIEQADAAEQRLVALGVLMKE